MTTMIAEIYDALKEAGASDDKAKAAARAIAEHEGRFSKTEADLLVLKWMAGFNLALVVAIVAKLFMH
ncbi:MAG: integrase [Alphaproteobacteria bacterium]